MVTIQLLVGLDDRGSLSAAAERLGISQPAASARLREFEARWKLSVAQRSSRGTSLTIDGQAIVQWARRVLDEAESFQSGLAALSAQRNSDLDIAASLTIAEFVLPKWLGELRVRLPDVRPHLSVVNSEAVLEAVRNSSATIGFVETTAVPQEVEHRIIGHDRLVIVVAPEHPWARRSYPVTLEHLQAANYVVRESGSGTRATFESALRMVPQIAIEASSTTAVIGAALAGAGPAVISALAVRNQIESGQLVAVETELELRRPLSAVWNRGQRLSEPAVELLRVATLNAVTRKALQQD